MTDEQMLLAMSNMMDAKLKPVNNEIQALKNRLMCRNTSGKSRLTGSKNIPGKCNITKAGRNRILLYWHI